MQDTTRSKTKNKQKPPKTKLALLITLLFFLSLQSTYGLSYTYYNLNIYLLRLFCCIGSYLLSFMIWKRILFSVLHLLVFCLLGPLILHCHLCTYSMYNALENFHDNTNVKWSVLLWTSVSSAYYVFDLENVIAIYRWPGRVSLLKVSVQENNGILIFSS